MATEHIIDEVVFDVSFDSMAIARAHESHINSWLTEQLLPVVDSILTTYDDAQTVLRMDHLALDLGDISSDDFYSEMIRKVSEQLAEQLRDARKNSVFEDSHADKSPSAARPSPSSSLSSSQSSPSIRQFSQAQVDAERLIDFLLTGNMAWHINKSETDVHEKMLTQVLQQTDATFIQFLQRSSVTTRNVLIRRLVQQFSPRYLASFLAKLAPTSAQLILDLMVVIQSESIQTQSDKTQPDELSKWLWMLTFETLLEEVQESDHQTAVIHKVFRKYEKLQAHVPDLIGDKLVKIAENLSSNQKINAELPKILIALIDADDKQIINKDVTSLDAPAPQELISHETQIIKNSLLPTEISAKHVEQGRITTSVAIYQCIVEAIIKANIPGIDAKVLTIGEPTELAKPDEIRRQLLLLIQQEEMRTQLAKELPERVLLDIVYLFSPQAAALTEQLLAQSTILFQATDAVKHSNQSRQSSIVAWQQQLWTGSLAALTAGQNEILDPADYLQELVRWLSLSESVSTIIQTWYTALVQSKNYGTLYNMLQQLIVQQDQHLLNVGVNGGVAISAESEPLAATLTKVSRSILYQLLYQRLSGTQPNKELTVDFQSEIDKLATDNPEELRFIFQALRRGELILAPAKLKGAELRSLVAALISVDLPDIGEVQQDLVQAIERYATQAKDQAVYYQLVLDALLQGETVDLEAFALQRQYAPTATSAPALDRGQTAKSTISERVQKISVPEVNSQTVNKAIYQRIVQAIVKVNLSGIDGEVRMLGKLAELVEPDEIRQQLLLLFEQAEIRVQLAEKLSERALLDIVYLFSPQAAALTEQLLAQSTILAQATDAEKQSSQNIQSSQSSIAAWRQQLWTGSLVALMTGKYKTFDPADYLQELMRWFSLSSSQSVSAVMQNWYTALGHSQNYGMLYKMLQQLIVQQNQHSFYIGANVDANGGDEASAELGPLPEMLTKISGSSAYKQLYQRLSATHPDKADKKTTVDLQVLIDILVTDSPAELHRIFQALRHGELFLATSKLQSVELQSLITALIQIESSDVNEFQQDFIQAIECHAAQATDQSIYYQRVLEALLQSEIMDLEAFASQIKGEPNSEEKSEALMKDLESQAYQQLYQRLSATQPDKVDKEINIDLQTVIDKLTTESPKELRLIFQALRCGELILVAAKLKHAELRSLVTALISVDLPDIGEVQQDFVQAIERHATQAKDPAVYYQLVLDALLHNEVVDLEAFALQRQYAPTATSTPALDRSQTKKSTISEKVQKASASEVNSQTINTAIYQRIVQAIVKANLSGIDAKVLTPGELTELAEPTEIRQQLLLLIEQAEIRAQLAEKLPERALLDIVYLFSPQATALTEQLLAQSTILAQATDAEKQSSQNIQSSQSSIAAWQQQMWIVSLAALMTAQEKMLDPAEYLQTLARWFSPTQSAMVVMQAWSTALVQSQKYGTLYNMLQQLIAQQDQHSFNVGFNVDANVDTEVRAESELLATSQTKISGSPAYQQLYQRLSATQSDKDITTDLQTVIGKLAGDSPEELRHIFQALRQGELSLSTAKLQSVELQRLLTALIQMDSSDVGEVQQDFAQAIERHAGQAKDQTVYYYLVLEALLQGEIVDLETFALKRVLESNRPLVAQNNAVDDISSSQEVLDSVVSAQKPALIILDDAMGFSSEAEVTEEIFINNAGQVLAAPYLPRLFSALNLMDDGDFIDRTAAERAVHLLQFMVNEQTQSPEYQLLLNKILCGITTGIPICREIVISAQEKALIEDFIRGMIQNWKTIGETSISGLRQTFLQRKGRLQLKEGMWYLTIEPGTFDMLLDGLPWSFSVIKHAWMERAIHVTWR